jgi:hypothetical protein
MPAYAMNRAPMTTRPMMNRPQVPMNRPMAPMNRVASAPAATPGIAAILAQKANMQQPSAIPSNLSSLPMRQDVSSMGLGSLPQAGQAGMPAYASPYQQQQAQGALDRVMSGMQQGQPIPDWAKNYIAQPAPMQQAPQGPSPYGAIQTGQLGSQPIQMAPPSDFQGQQQAQQQLDGMLGQYGPPPPSFGIQQGPQAQQNQMGTLANLSQMFNSMGGQQPAQQGGTPLQNNSSPLQQSAQPVMNMGVM